MAEEKDQTKIGSDKINLSQKIEYMQKNNGFINKSRTNHELIERWAIQCLPYVMYSRLYVRTS